MKAYILVALIALSALSSNIEGRTVLNLDSSSSQSGSTTDQNFGNALLNFILAYKNIMPCGVPQWGIPQLAPFTLANWPFDYTNGQYRVNGTITNLIVTGLNDYQIINYNFDTTSGQLTFDVMYNEIQVVSEYTMNAWAMVAGYNASMAGDGPLNWKVKDARALGHITIGPSNEKPSGLMLSDFNGQFFIGDIVTGSWNNQWDISFNNFANRWFREFLLMWAQQIQGDVDSFYDTNYIQQENQQLENVSMAQAINFLVETAQEMNAMNCNSNQS